MVPAQRSAVNVALGFKISVYGIIQGNLDGKEVCLPILPVNSSWIWIGVQGDGT